MNQGDQILTRSHAHLEIRPPKLFRFGSLLIVTGYGIFLMLPIVLSILLVSIMQLGVFSFIIPVLSVFIVTIALPIGFGNLHVCRLLEKIPPPDNVKGPLYRVQVALTPRLRGGIRGLLEDADDIGWLALTDSAVVYHGDAVQFTLPFSQVRRVIRETSGWRGLFAYGARTVVEVDQLPNVAAFEFAERGSQWLPESRKAASDLFASLRQAKP